jgi:hypothetical protein
MCQTAGGGIPRQAFLRINKLPTSVDTFPNFGGYVCKSDAGCCSRRGGFRYRRLEGGLSDLLTEDGPSPCDAHIAALRYRGGLAAVGCVWRETNERERRRKDEFSESLGPFPFRYFNLFSTLSREKKKKKKRKVIATQSFGAARLSRIPSGDLSLAHHSLFLSTFTDGPLWREICLCCFRPCAAIRASPLRDESAVLHKPLCVAHTVNPGRSYDIDTFREFYLPCPSPSQLDDIIFAPTRKLKDIFLFRQSAIYN